MPISDFTFEITSLRETLKLTSDAISPQLPIKDLYAINLFYKGNKLAIADGVNNKFRPSRIPIKRKFAVNKDYTTVTGISLDVDRRIVPDPIPTPNPVPIPTPVPTPTPTPTPTTNTEYRSAYSTVGGFRHYYSSPSSELTLRDDQGYKLPKSYKFRIYIPPSICDYFTFALFCPQKSKIGVAVRLGSPPETKYDNGSVSDDEYINGITWDGETKSLSNLRQRTYLMRNGSGTISIASDYSPTSVGEWLYVKVLFDGTSITNVVNGGISFVHQINQNTFITWFNSVAWNSAGDPP